MPCTPIKGQGREGNISTILCNSMYILCNSLRSCGWSRALMVKIVNSGIVRTIGCCLFNQYSPPYILWEAAEAYADGQEARTVSNIFLMKWLKEKTSHERTDFYFPFWISLTEY